MPYTLRVVPSPVMNVWLTQVHYLHRPIIRSKMLAHGIFVGGHMVGGILWATPHFTKKRALFGFPDTYDKWEVLMLARFYLAPDCGLTASTILSDSIGIAGRRAKARRRGWRVQRDWVRLHPPLFPQLPFVPRLLISWADRALPPVIACAVCGATHQGEHKGTIYQASNWQVFDVSTSGGRRTGRSYYAREAADRDNGHKICYVLHLPANPRVTELGQHLCTPQFAELMR